jgi:hemolysin activation/secretion protein
MPFESYMSMRSQFQMSSKTLPSSEQFQLGGANSVRGYPEGDYLADIGANLNLDWIFPFYLFPKEIRFPYADMPLRNQLQPVIFLDLGGGGIMKPSPGERQSKFLMGVGGGLRFQFNRNIFLRLDWAGRVATEEIPGQGPSNFYVTVQAEV